MFVATDYLPPAAIVITVKQQPENKQPKLPRLFSEAVPPVKDGPGGRTSGGGR